MHAHLTTNWLETVTTPHVATRRTLQLEFVPYASDHVRRLFRQRHILLPVVWSQPSPLPQHMQSSVNRCSVSHLRRTYRVLHEHMFEERQKTRRNEFGKSLIANESSHSCSQTAQHSVHHSTLVATECIQKTPTPKVPAMTQRNFIEQKITSICAKETQNKRTHKTTKQTSQRTHYSAQNY